MRYARLALGVDVLLERSAHRAAVGTTLPLHHYIRIQWFVLSLLARMRCPGGSTTYPVFLPPADATAYTEGHGPSGAEGDERSAHGGLCISPSWYGTRPGLRGAVHSTAVDRTAQ